MHELKQEEGQKDLSVTLPVEKQLLWGAETHGSFMHSS